MPDEMSDSDKDLPMSANLQDIAINHFVLDLVCKIDKHIFEGSITFWYHRCVGEKRLDINEQCKDFSSTRKLAEGSIKSGIPVEDSITSGKHADNISETPVVGISGNLDNDSFSFSGSVVREKSRSEQHFPCGCPENVEVAHMIGTPSDCRVDGYQADQLVNLHQIAGKACAICDKSGHCCLNIPSVSFQQNCFTGIKPEDVHNLVQTHTLAGQLEHVQDNKGQSEHDYFVQDVKGQSKNDVYVQDSAVLHEQPVTESTDHGDSFKMILDSYKVDILKVEGIFLQGEEKLSYEKNPDVFVKTMSERDVALECSIQHRPLKYLVKEHCIHIFMETGHTAVHFPHAVKIWYSTRPEGPSLKWTIDQDENPCVFTIGHFLSNRSLFPSQDSPTALLTWQAAITVDSEFTVLLTGDNDPQVTTVEDGQKRFSYRTQFPMPSCTFGIAVGRWDMEILSYCTLKVDSRSLKRPPVRLFFPKRLKGRSVSVLGQYIPHCLLEVQKILGTYPFHRLDVLLVPACFDSLGMASPSLLFLSQSLLCPDGSMCVRVAHELCHTWFGIVIGPLDWTEEWMTEGFCTYLEDILHMQISEQPQEAADEYIRLRAQLNLRIIQAELRNTDDTLHTLRPNKGEAIEVQGTGEETRFIKNGMNIDKKFMQVHYLKGYFLLRKLEMTVGRARFLTFLKDYVQRFLYQLVTSQDFLQMFFDTFPDCMELSVHSINTSWLDCPELPEGLEEMAGCENDSTLTSQVSQQLILITNACRRGTRGKRRRGRRLPNFPLLQLNQMQACQVVLMFDRLLEERRVPGHVLDHLKQVHGHHFDNAEVCHRWCELVVKHKHKKCYVDLERFLRDHQAMGVYLYGEAMISKCLDLIHLVRTSFRQLQDHMPESVREAVSGMLFAT